MKNLHRIFAVLFAVLAVARCAEIGSRHRRRGKLNVGQFSAKFTQLKQCHMAATFPRLELDPGLWKSCFVAVGDV